MIGFIGLGIMGKPMALNLIRAGGIVMANDLSKVAADDIQQNGGKIGSYTEIGANCQVIFTMLSGGGVVRDVLFGKNGVVTTAKKGTIICDMSSVTPEDATFCYEKLEAVGIEFLDAPVSGGEPGAIDGSLAFMVGGKKAVYREITPYFELMGNSSVLIGPSGSGSIAKLANQIIVNNTIAVISEAFTFAAKVGADPAKVFQCLFHLAIIELYPL